MNTRVVNIKRESYDVYIGRPSPWGNPYSHRPSNVHGVQYVGSVTEAILQFETWARSDPQYVARIKRELKGKVLGCFCKPQPCHGDVLARIAEET